MKTNRFDIKENQIKKTIAIVIIAILYFGFLAFTMYKKISETGFTEDLLQIAIIVIAFALASYYMFFYALRQFNNRHVPDNKRLEELEITKRRIVSDKMIAILFLILGIVFMIFTLL